MAAERTPRSLIVSFYGAFGRGEGPGGGGRVPVAALIRLLGAVGVDAPAVRSAVSRLKRRGLLVPVRHEGEAAYALSPSARTLLDDGDRRIYRHPARTGRPDAPGGPGGWLLAVFSVPEYERRKRHLLRSRLARLGFGQAAPGVWIAPAHVAEETRHTLRRLELAPYVDLFRGVHEGFTPTPEAVARWWDLPATAKLHETFLDAQEPVLRRWSSRTPAGADAYRDYLLALDAWRHLPYADPGLPPEVLPRDWPGGRAAEVFAALHDRLRGPAADFVNATLHTP